MTKQTWSAVYFCVTITHLYVCLLCLLCISVALQLLMCRHWWLYVYTICLHISVALQLWCAIHWWLYVYTICLHTNGYMFTYQWQCLYAPMPLHTNDSAFAYQCLYCSHWCVQPLMWSDTAIGVSESICVCVRKVLPCLSVCVYFCDPAGLGVYSHCHWYKKALVHTVIVIWHCDMVP